MSYPSPFDNLLIQRKKVKDIFEFDYQIERYVPEPKRKFGYFSLPILFQDQLVAQIDCKVDRRSQTLFIKSFHVTNGLDREMLFHNLQGQLQKFAKFNECVQISMKSQGG